MEIVDISLWRMALLYSFLVIPVYLMWKLKVPLIGRLWISAGRMTLPIPRRGMSRR